MGHISIQIPKNTVFYKPHKCRNCGTSITGKYNEKIEGEIKLFSNHLNYISLKTSKSSKKYVSISIPIGIPTHIKNEIEENFEGGKNNYLDLIKDEINQNYIKNSEF